MARVTTHLSVSELEREYRAAKEATAARHYQAIWLLAKGHTGARGGGGSRAPPGEAYRGLRQRRAPARSEAVQPALLGAARRAPGDPRPPSLRVALRHRLRLAGERHDLLVPLQRCLQGVLRGTARALRPRSRRRKRAFHHPGDRRRRMAQRTGPPACPTASASSICRATVRSCNRPTASGRCSTSPSPTNTSKPSSSSMPSSPHAAAPSKPRPTSSKGTPNFIGGPSPAGRTD